MAEGRLEAPHDLKKIKPNLRLVNGRPFVKAHYDILFAGRKFDNGSRDFSHLPKLSLHARFVYLVLQAHGEDPQHCYPSIDRISGLAGISRNSTKRALKELEEARYIVQLSGKRSGTSNSYGLIGGNQGGPETTRGWPTESHPGGPQRATNKTKMNKTKEKGGGGVASPSAPPPPAPDTAEEVRRILAKIRKAPRSPPPAKIG